MSAYISVELSDFSDEEILREADRIRLRRSNYADRMASRLDIGEMAVFFSAWEALKLREAIEQRNAYSVLDLMNEVIAKTAAKLVEA